MKFFVTFYLTVVQVSFFLFFVLSFCNLHKIFCTVVWDSIMIFLLNFLVLHITMGLSSFQLLSWSYKNQSVSVMGTWHTGRCHFLKGRQLFWLPACIPAHQALKKWVYSKRVPFKEFASCVSKYFPLGYTPFQKGDKYNLTSVTSLEGISIPV